MCQQIILLCVLLERISKNEDPHYYHVPIKFHKETIVTALLHMLQIINSYLTTTIFPSPVLVVNYYGLTAVYK